VKFQKAAEDAEARGDDPREAARQIYERQCADARRNTKREMRLWSPALFRPGGRRESDDVISMSCLVLDYDDGTPIVDATEVWGRWYHICHTTWSHTPALHKFRIIFPLMDLVPARDWDPVYLWAEARAVGQPDHSKKGVATTFALPTIGALRWPREAFVHKGELLDPVSEGLVPAHKPIVVPALPPAEVQLQTGDPEATYVAHQGVDPHAWTNLESDDLWSGGAVAGPAVPLVTPAGGAVTHAPPTGVAPLGATEVNLADRLLAAAEVVSLDAAGLVDTRDLVDRLDALLARGLLTRLEHRQALDRLYSWLGEDF